MTRVEAAEAALREVAEMPCTSPGSGRIGLWADCRQREREARSRLTPENQRAFWCPRCVAADAVERLDSGDVRAVAILSGKE